MSAKRMIGIVLVIIGLVGLASGGLFWTKRDKVIDAGPLQVTTEKRDGVAIPPVVGFLALVGGIVLIAVPERRRA